MIYIRPLGKEERRIEWSELSQLRKDILWMFDQNTSDLNAAFVERESFQSYYWEYLTLVGPEALNDEDIKFYKNGALIIILCMTIEYIDTTAGDQQIFGANKIDTILQHVDNLETVNADQEKLKQLVRLGLTIANTMTETDLLNSDGYDHRYLPKFYEQLDWADMTFIKSYFQSKSATTYVQNRKRNNKILKFFSWVLTVVVVLFIIFKIKHCKNVLMPAPGSKLARVPSLPPNHH